MMTKLHLIANEEGVFDGISANYSGGGFSGMRFKAIATSEQGFQDWVAKVKAAPASLSIDTYPELVKPSENVPPTHFFGQPGTCSATSSPSTSTTATPRARARRARRG